MKVLVTGAAGFLGAAVVERLLAHGYRDIRCNVRQRANFHKLDALVRQYSDARLECCVGNLKYHNDAARAVEGVDFIFHLAAGKKGAAADLFQDSVVASRNLLDAISDCKPMRIVLVSSFGVYGVAETQRGALLNEQTPLEPHPEWRDHYSHAKLRQEQLFWEYQRQKGFELIVLRPGVVYGPKGDHFSNRVGIRIGGWLVHCGRRNLLPLTYVDNCAEAVVIAGTHKQAAGQVYNVHDDDLPTCAEYLSAYKRQVANVPSISMPYIGMKLLSRACAAYHRYSQGQLPAILTPYRAKALWGGNRFDNSRLHSIGWRQLVPTGEGLRRTFAAFKCQLRPANRSSQVHQVSTAELRRSPDEFVIGVVLGPERNGEFENLLTAFADFRRSCKSVQLVVMGRHGCQQLAGAVGADQEFAADVHCLTEDSGSDVSLRACDVLVSVQEGTPSLVLQAMSLGIPVITTAIRVPEVIQNKRTAIQVPRGDRNALIREMKYLFEQPAQKTTLGAASSAEVANQYSATNLWHVYAARNVNEGESKSRALIKKALFRTVPESYLLQHGNRHRAEIALSIDDGPDDVYTPQILDIFRHYGVKATFFVVGGCAEQYPDIVARMGREGHEVGSHSYSHPYFNRLSWGGALQEIRMTSAVLNRILGQKCQLFRPPFGKLSLRSLLPAWAEGQRVVMWNVDLKDYSAATGDLETQLNRTRLMSGDIILYHGYNDVAIKSLPTVIEAALANGRKAVTISEIIRPQFELLHSSNCASDKAIANRSSNYSS